MIFVPNFSWLIRPCVSCQTATAGMMCEGGEQGRYRPGLPSWLWTNRIGSGVAGVCLQRSCCQPGSF